MIIVKLSKEKEKAWDEYIKNHKQSSFYHQIGWKNIVEKTYKHKPVYLIAEENNKIKGVLPLFLMQNLFFGKRLISLPFGSYGGPVSDNRNIDKLLIEKAKEITIQQKLDFFELRNEHNKIDSLKTNEVYTTLILELNQDSNEVWENKLKSNVRNKTRSSFKAGFEFLIDSQYLKDFYRLYSKNMKFLGTPVHSFKFFQNLLQEFPKNFKLFLVRKDENIVSAMIILFFKDSMISAWQAADRNFLNLKPNNYLYWQTIKYGCDNSYKYFDFGRSISKSGTFAFKKAWGAKVNQLNYQYYLNKVSKMPDTSQANQKRKKFAKFWKTLPFFITNQLGPYIRRNLP